MMATSTGKLMIHHGISEVHMPYAISQFQTAHRAAKVVWQEPQLGVCQYIYTDHSVEAAFEIRHAQRNP
jgi:hypothetical protein